MTAHVLLLGLAVALYHRDRRRRPTPRAIPALTDAPPPVPLGIIEGSAAPVAPVAPRPQRALDRRTRRGR